MFKTIGGLQSSERARVSTRHGLFSAFLVCVFLLPALSFLPNMITVASVNPRNSIPEGPLVVSDRWPECTDLRTWMQDVMRLEGLENANETAQAKAFFRWLRLFSKMATGGMIQAYEGPYGRESYVLDVHKNAFVYGW